ncbi:response regulator receiver domain-containing protein [Chitinophaga polysaccharea]|uniref:Response regulator receiver domain-containing protein n=1 Tax=Chitinophaga polysaccharea TaxID=1293035 RepID=A0A561Q5Q8_9BACT|nr:response regulator [Chitinophaga polysaccharea]TWF45683.1 response regulator receiver domain-containing protein [Chitinophaga polysaccharea]
MQYRCAIVDDEPLALDILENYIQRTSYLKLVKKASELTTVKKLIAERKVDLVFLDVNLRGNTRDIIAQFLQQDCVFILVTAYSSREVQHLYWKEKQGYLGKPASYKKFVDEMERVIPGVKLAMT